MKYFVHINGSEYEVEISDKDISLNGEPLQVDWAQVSRTHHSLLVNNRSYEAVVKKMRHEYQVVIAGKLFTVDIEDERQRRLNRGRTQLLPTTGELTINAPIPGLIVKVLVQPGDEVAENQALAILEAMKMENEIRAPRAGVIGKVSVNAGENVKQGMVICTLD